MNLMEFISESNKMSDTGNLTEVFLRFLSDYGLERFVMSEMSHDSTVRKSKNHGLLVNYPSEWMKRYTSNGYVEYDPIYQAALVSKNPFTWKKIREKQELRKNARKVMDEAREYGLHDGVGLSIHRPLGKIIGMGFARTVKDKNFSKDELSVIYAAANQFLAVHEDINSINTREEKEVCLTEREKDVLLWLARGKSKSVVADILYISESTVKRHCEHIFLKLGANNVPMAVMKALRKGLVKPY